MAAGEGQAELAEEVRRLRARVSQLMQRVIGKDKEFQLERDGWKRKQREYERTIRELRAGKRAVDDEEF